jgi:hypothetical protein
MSRTHKPLARRIQHQLISVRAVEPCDAWSTVKTALDLGMIVLLGVVADLSNRFMGVSTGCVGSFLGDELVFCSVLQFGS